MADTGIPKGLAPELGISAMLSLMKFVTLLCISLWATLGAGATLANAQRTTMLNLAQMPQWQIAKSQNVSLSDVQNWGVEPAVDKEYGVKKIEIRTYRKGNQSIKVLVEKLPDASSAYGLLTFYQNESMQPELGMKLTMIGPKQALMARGIFFVRVQRPVKPKMSDPAFRSALIDIAGATPSANDMTMLPPSLPAKGLVVGSVKYILGPVASKQALPSLPADLVGYQQGAELESGVYGRNGHQATLILISYPTPQIAHLHYEAMVKKLGMNQKTGPGAIFGKMKGTYVLLVQHAESKSVASRVLDKLTVKQQFSWDQPPPGKPMAVQMVHLILGNIFLVIILGLLAIIAGVLLVFSRRIAAKIFPHSDWARAYEDSIIRLNLK